MAELVKIKLHLTRPQFHKLRTGKHIQLTHAQMMKGEPHHLMVHPHTAKKMHHAMKHNKGVRIHMSKDEFDKTAEGGGFMDFINGLKNAGKWVKEKIIDTPFYQQNIKPIARNLVNAGVAAVAPRLGPAAPLATSAVDAIGSATNAYGLKKHHKPEHHKSEHHGTMSKFVVQSMVAPIPGQSGFTALPAPATGDGIHGKHAQIIHHHYYYPYDHGHVGGRGGKFGGKGSGSFRMA